MVTMMTMAMLITVCHNYIVLLIPRQNLLREELQSTLVERGHLEEAVNKLGGRSEVLRAFLDAKIGA
jgi:hypothetical protein